MDIGTQRTDHPSVEDLAAFLDRTLLDTEHALIVEHLEQCEVCRLEVAVAVDTLSTHNRRRRALKWAVPMVAAAAIAMLLLMPATSVVIPGDPAPIERGERAEGIGAFSVVSPAEDEVLGAPPTFVWRSAGSGVTYALTVTDEVGDVVWSGQASDTVMVAPVSLTLPSGSYFWIVDALLERGRKATTGVQRFQMNN